MPFKQLESESGLLKNEATPLNPFVNEFDAPKNGTTHTVLQDLAEPAELSFACLNCTVQHAPVATTVTTKSTNKRVAERLAGIAILLAEDNLVNQILARTLLVRAGAHVEVAPNGHEAVEILRQRANQFNLVLMDVQMPVMDGLIATRLLREQLNLTLPILAMSAGTAHSEREACRIAGMNDFIAKPLCIISVIDTILQHVSVAPGDEEIIVGTALFEICNDQPDFRLTLIELIKNMMAQSQPQLQRVRHCLQHGQPLASASILHDMRGSIGFLEAKLFTSTALALEKAIKQNDQARIPGLLEETELALEQVLQAVQPWLEKLGSGSHSIGT